MPGQAGSSAMPHKRNPEKCERICGQARVLRAFATTALENVALWHERDISHTSTERIIIPDACLLLDYMLDLFTWIVGGLEVYPERMRRNLDSSFGLVFSQRVLLALVETGGMPRDAAYKLVQAHAMTAWHEECAFFDLLAADETVSACLSAQQLEECFDASYYLRNINGSFERLGI